VIAYLDSSVILRVILGQRDELGAWKSIERGVASALVRVECLRTLDRLRLRAGLSDEDLAERRETVFRIIDETEVAEPSLAVLDRAARPFPTELGTLDAIHLATALMWREARGEEIVMATHDRALGTAAQASGLRVAGLR
jgi:predicted nucleic acid-binding protein